MAMSKTAVLALALGALCLTVSASEASEHPIAGVISMIEGLEVTAKEEGAVEVETYNKYSKWCSLVHDDLSNAISGHKDQIVVHEDSIQAAEKDILTLERNIAKLDKEITRRMGAQAKADENRKEEEADYDAEQSDITDTIDTMDMLIKALDMLVESKKKANAGASALLATKAAKHAAKLLQVVALSEEQEKALTAFTNSMRQPADVKDKVGGADMSSIADLVKGMRVDFEKKRVESTKEETQSKNNYNLAKQAQDYAISESEGSKGEKETILGDRKSDLAELKSDLSDEEGLRDSETANLQSHDAGCATKAEEWETRSKIRAGELKAMDMAVEILQKVTHVRNPDTYEKRAHEGSGPESFLQVDDPRTKAVNLLKAVAKKRHSKSLARLADDVAHMSLQKQDPFAQMNSMLQKMIFRLMAEQKDEDDHKNWCDMELEKSTESKGDKDNRMEMLNTKIKTAKADIAELTQAISDNEAEVAAITEYVKEEREIRAENKAENAAAIKDNNDAKRAVDQAIKVLVTFYKESGQIAKQPYEFVQTEKKEILGQQRSADIELPEEPSTWGAGYTGVQDPEAEGEGVIAILTATGEKFATMEADVKAQEESDDAAFQKDMTEQAMDKAAREQDTTMKSNRKTSMAQKLDGMESSKKHLTTELDAVNQYLKDLEPACVSGDSSYEERKQARADEIEALRKSQNILADAFKPEEGFLQKVRAHKA